MGSFEVEQCVFVIYINAISFTIQTLMDFARLDGSIRKKGQSTTQWDQPLGLKKKIGIYH